MSGVPFLHISRTLSVECSFAWKQKWGFYSNRQQQYQFLLGASERNHFICLEDNKVFSVGALLSVPIVCELSRRELNGRGE